MKIGICGNIELRVLAAAVDGAVPKHDIVVGRTGAYAEELSKPFGDFTRLDLCILALDWRGLVPDLYACAFGDSAASILGKFTDICNGIKDAIDRYRSVCPARFLVFSPITPRYSPLGFIDRLTPSSTHELAAGCQRIFNEFCRSITDLYPVDIDMLSRGIGTDHAFDDRSRLLELQPFTPLMTGTLAAQIGAMIAQFTKFPLKCLVLDLDNTLWGGVVGEEESRDLVLGDSGPGLAYREFQAEIVRLHRQGVIIAVCSKNNTCDALEAIEQHPQMLIRPSMVSCFRINWDDKPKNMIQIAAELNIGLDAIMFVDDNPAERAAMRATLPEVEILELPADPAYFAEALRKCTRFWPLSITADDANKASFFAQERARKGSRELSADLETFLMNSDIRARIARADEASMPRITQLFNKTNQFNLTVRRYTQQQLETLVTIPNNLLVSMDMQDKYGEYGLIASALIINDAIDSFILSCRAFGRHAEQALLIYLLKHLKASGRSQVLGQYVRTQKNVQTKDFYREMGFKLLQGTENEAVWRFDLGGSIPEIPRWISIEGDLA